MYLVQQYVFSMVVYSITLCIYLSFQYTIKLISNHKSLKFKSTYLTFINLQLIYQLTINLNFNLNQLILTYIYLTLTQHQLSINSNLLLTQYYNIYMSSSRLRNLSKGEHILDVRRDVTPKSKQTKLSTMFSNGKLPLRDKSKHEDSQTQTQNKIRDNRPLSTKNTDSTHKYFTAKDNENIDKKKIANYTSNKQDQSPKKNTFTQSQAIRWKSRSPKRLDDDTIKEEIFIHPRKYNIGSRDIRHSINPHPRIPKFVQNLPNHQPAKHSMKANGIIRCYAACTNQGPCRTYNEDRVAIILNTSKPEHCTVQWKKAAFFGVYDGHGGVACADYLRDNLHSFIFKEKTFPNNISEAIAQGFQKCEVSFLQKSRSLPIIDRSGSCAIVVFIYDEMCYVANVGDSRAIMSSNGGQRISELSIDHKPSDDFQQKRVTEHGGKIYQVKIKNRNPNLPIVFQGQELPYLLGPCRVLPGRLAITRSMGDIEAKLSELGGNSKVVIATPEIRSFRITSDTDFILLASDGIFDKVSNQEIIQIVWQTSKERDKYKSVHELCGLVIEKVMKYSLYKRTQDNITNFQRLVKEGSQQQRQSTKSGQYMSNLNSSLERQKVQSSMRTKTPPHLQKKKPSSITTSYSFLEKNKMEMSRKEPWVSRYSPTANDYKSMSFKRSN